MNDVTKAVNDAFPDETEFVVMTRSDWDRLLRYVNVIGLPQPLQDLRVLTVELVP